MSTAASAWEGLEEQIETMRAGWGVPGCGVVILKHGQEILKRGFGLADVSNNIPVDVDTVFEIGSCSKSFTSAACAMLVDRGLLDWDRPIKDYMPWFDLKDAYAGSHVTTRDLLCHRTGLPRHDYGWYFSPLSRRELVEKLRYFEPNKPFRSAWQYQNMMFVVAGYLVEAITGQTWEAFVQENFFAPLGMDCSNFRVGQPVLRGSYAKPYVNSGGPVEVPYYDFYKSGGGSIIGPAGSINAPISDMAKWLSFQLGGGYCGDKRLLSEEAFAEMHRPQMIENLPLPWDGVGSPSYGLGWVVNHLYGNKIVYHCGNIDGFSALVGMMPTQKLGICLLTNLNFNRFSEAVMYNVFDRVLGVQGNDWDARLHAVFQSGVELSQQKRAIAQKQGTNPSHPLSDYAGVYTNPGYGEMTLSCGEDGLCLAFYGCTGKLKHFHYDTFMVTQSAIGAPLTFSADKSGSISSFTIPLGEEDDLADILFRRVN